MLTTPDQNTSAPKTKATCACDTIVASWAVKRARSACLGEAVYAHEGKSFCVMHYPNQNKVEVFRSKLQQKLDAADFNFCGIYFPEDINFADYQKLSDDKFCFVADADFSFAEFSGATFFYKTIFSEKVYFNQTNFIGVAWFSNATFNGTAHFRFATFGNITSFINATFSGLTSFKGAQFHSKTNFNNAQFKDYVIFKYCDINDLKYALSTGKIKHSYKQDIKMFGAYASLDFDSLQIEKPERLSFHSVKLRPHWFINTDPRKFEFIDVRWENDLKKEREASNSDRLLSIAYGQLAMNAEENNRYDEAMDFRKKSMETSLFSLQEKWREDWLKRRWGKYSFETFSWWWEYGTIRKLFSLTWWYRTLSSYGESPTRAAIALLLILFLSCVPYWFTGFASSKDTTPNNKGVPLRMIIEPKENKAKQFLATLVYSLETASLQKPEPRPVTTMARLFVGLETILAPLQAALLALAIRRKYMR